LLLLLREHFELWGLLHSSGNSSAWLNSDDSDCGNYGFFFGYWDYAYGNFGSYDCRDFGTALRTGT
jgi:hypothetical protein